MTADATIVTPSREDLAKTLATAEQESTTADAKAKNEGAKAMAEGDMVTAITIANAAKQAVSKVESAKTALSNFESETRWRGLNATNAPLQKLLQEFVKEPVVISAASLTGTAKIDSDGNVAVSLQVRFPQNGAASALEEAIKAHVTAHKDEYSKAAVNDLSFNIAEIGGTGAHSNEITLGPTALIKKASSPKAKGTKAEGGTSNGLSVKDFDAVATDAEQAELAMLLEAEKGTKSNSKSYAFKLRVVKASA